MLNVAIAVDAPTDYGPEAVRVVAAACEEVIGAQRCPVASDLAPGEVAAWYAVVHPNDRGLTSIRIDFRDRTADGVLIEQRSLTFAPLDSQSSRLASAGSVIAALAAAREGALTHPTRAEETLTRPPVPVANVAAPQPPPPDWSLDLAATAAPPLASATTRWGGLAEAHVGLGRHAFGLVSARYEGHPGDPSFSWWTLSAGVGLRIGDRSSPFQLELSGAFVFEYTRIEAERAGGRESAGQDGSGGRAAAEVVWATWRHVSLILGVDGTFVLPRIHLVVGDETALGVPLASVGLVFGVRLQP